MDAFWEIVTGAPWWVYVIFIYLVITGMKATKPRTISIKKIIIFPIIFLAWAIYSLIIKIDLGLYSLIPVWIVCLTIGAYLAVQGVRSWKISKNRQTQEITIPGNYSTLVFILLIFFIRFFWGYIYATRTEISYLIYFGDTVTSALITGFFVGRGSFFLKSYYK